MPSPYPRQTIVPEWDEPWGDYLFEGNCGWKHNLHQWLDIGWRELPPGRWQEIRDGIPVAEAMCSQHNAWKVSPEAIQENLGIQYGAIFEDVNMIMRGSFATYGTGAGKGLSQKEWETIQNFWIPKTEAEFAKVSKGTSLLPFVPIWNKLNTETMDWFCQFKPWVPIRVWKADQSRIRKLNAAGTWIGSVAPKGAILVKGKVVTGGGGAPAMIQPTCYWEAASDVLAETKKGTKAFLFDHLATGVHQATISQAIDLAKHGYATQAQQDIAESDEAQEYLPPDDQRKDDAPPPDDEDKKGNMLPLILAGLGFVAAGPPGALGGFALGAMVAKGEK